MPIGGQGDRLAGVLTALAMLPFNDHIQIGEDVGRNVMPRRVPRSGEDS